MEFELKTKALAALAILEKVLQVVLRRGRKRSLELRGAEAPPPHPPPPVCRTIRWKGGWRPDSDAGVEARPKGEVDPGNDGKPLKSFK